MSGNDFMMMTITDEAKRLASPQFTINDAM